LCPPAEPAPPSLHGRSSDLSAMYIGSQFGPGPRDGLMTGISRVTGRSIRLVRTLIEVSVVAVGWLLGGVVGVGTVLYALGIGPRSEEHTSELQSRFDLVCRL